MCAARSSDGVLWLQGSIETSRDPSKMISLEERRPVVRRKLIDVGAACRVRSNRDESHNQDIRGDDEDSSDAVFRGPVRECLGGGFF